MPNAINYATEYSRELDQAYPYALYFGALYATPNNGRYRWINAKTIEIPSITTTGRVPADRDTITLASRNYDNAWVPKALTNERKWSTLVHPMDIDQTNMVASIANITRIYNEEQKFPEMDAYTLSKIYADWTTAGKTANTTVPTEENVLTIFDTMMLNADNARVPVTGRILYCTNEVKTMIKNAQQIIRQINLNSSNGALNRTISRIDEVEIIGVPANLMKTLYNFTTGWSVATGAKQVNMFLVHPLSVITPVKYEYANLDAPSSLSEGKWVYYEESHEDVFVLDHKIDGIQFNVEPDKSTNSSGGTGGGTET